MANKTINQLTNLGSVDDSDEFVVYDVSTGKTKKVTKSNLLKLDNYPISGSGNLVKSSGIFLANAVIMASSTTITNAPTISNKSIIRVMFTSAITGSDTATGMSISYNGTSYAVKVGKQGSLSDFVASDISGAYKYLQAYTTLELAFDGTQFIIIGNPVVLSSSDYTIYADGKNVKISADLYTISTSIPGDVVDFDALKNYLLQNISSYSSGISFINFDSINQMGTFILSKTRDDYFSCIYCTSYLTYLKFFNYNNGTWTSSNIGQ